MNGKIIAYLSDFEGLKKCFDLADENHTKYCGFKVMMSDEGKVRIYLYWYKPQEVSIMEKNSVSWFPYEMNSRQVAEFVWGWLEQVDYGEHGEECDGSYGKGFKFEASDFGNCIKGCSESNVAVVVMPMWFYYGK